MERSIMSDQLEPVVTSRYTLIHGDSIPAMAAMRPASVALTICSPPFADLFVYSRDEADLGNNRDGAFNLAFRMWCEQLLRVMAPGRLVCLHVTQLLAYKVMHGYMGLRDFCGHVAEAMSSAGFVWAGEWAIAKNPQAAAQRMKLHNLMFVTLRKDSSKSIPVRNDYLLVFRAPGDNIAPVLSFERGDVTEDDWVRLASGVWRPIQETNVLKTDGTGAEDDSKHVCPLQLDLIDDCVRLWSNPDELVMDPFDGIGSTAYTAVKRGRRALGIDLKRENHLTATRTLAELIRSEATQRAQGKLFEAAASA
jgi:DNA modification methylase